MPTIAKVNKAKSTIFIGLDLFVHPANLMDIALKKKKGFARQKFLATREAKGNFAYPPCFP